MSIENYGAFKYYNCFFIWPLSIKYVFCWSQDNHDYLTAMLHLHCLITTYHILRDIFESKIFKIMLNCLQTMGLWRPHNKIVMSFFYLCKYIEKSILYKFIIKIHNYDSFLTELNLFWELHCPFWDFPPSSVNKNKITFQTNAHQQYPICMQSVLLLLIALRGSKMQKHSVRKHYRNWFWECINVCI